MVHSLKIKFEYMLNHKTYLKQLKLKLINLGQKIYIITAVDPAIGRLNGPENRLNFKLSTLVESKVSCRFLNTVKKKILTGSCLLMSEMTRVIACSCVTYDYMKIYET